MTTLQSLLFFLCGVCTSFLVHFLLTNLTSSFQNQSWTKENLTLAIGILSAPENFQHRDAIRTTWKSNINNKEKAWFIIGEKDCQIHPDNRIDKYGCQKNNVRVQHPKSIKENILTINALTLKSKIKKLGRNVIYKLNFKVKSDVYVKRLGVVAALLSEEPDVTVNILEAWTENVIASVKFSEMDTGIIIEDCAFQPVSDVILMKNYEYILEIENNFKYTLSNFEVETTLHDWGGILHYQTELKNGDIILPTMWLKVYSVDHDRQLKNENELNFKWQQQIRHIRQQLKFEADTYQDILFVDTVDVYRKLPVKLLLFHKWLFENTQTKFILKTDDDCFINLALIRSDLSELEEMDSTFLWWGNFRKQWLVQGHGKWAEFSYTADVYPSFACGSGNIINVQIHEWLVKNADDLHLYQGEDVSMGIWLSAVSPVRVEDQRWQCSNSCTSESLSIPELHPTDMIKHWQNLQFCDNPCSC